MDSAYVIHRCRGCGSVTLGQPEELWHLRNRCPGRIDPAGAIERVTLEPVSIEPAELDGALPVINPDTDSPAD